MKVTGSASSWPMYNFSNKTAMGVRQGCVPVVVQNIFIHMSDFPRNLSQDNGVSLADDYLWADDIILFSESAEGLN